MSTEAGTVQTEPGGNCTDPSGTPYSTTNLAPATSGCLTYAYGKTDQRTLARFPGGQRQATGYDPAGRITSIRGGKTAPTPPVTEFTYSYSKNGADTALLQTRTDTLPATDLVQSYDYDTRNQLTRATERAGTTATAVWAYCYDGAGNRTYDSTSLTPGTLCPGQAGGPAPTASYDATNALRGRAGQSAPNTTFSYDGNGNETAAAGVNTRTAGTYNPKNQLTTLRTGPAGASTAHTFSYAGNSQNERTTADSTRYRNTPLGLTAQTNPDNVIVREPGGAPAALRLTTSSGTASFYYLTDNQGSVVSLVDTAGNEANHYSYDPYGNTRTATESPAVPNPLRLHRRLPRHRHRPVQTRHSLLRPHPRPLHPTRPHRPEPPLHLHSEQSSQRH